MGNLQQYEEPTLTSRQNASIQRVIYWADQAAQYRQFQSNLGWLKRTLKQARRLFGPEHESYHELCSYLENAGFHSTVQEVNRD